MKTKPHKANERGTTKISWLESKHSFSFGNYYDPQKMGFGMLRVLNDDIIAPGKGFSTHPHANMEIISIVLEGALEHKDTMHNKGTISAGDIQVMSAGSGVQHSEWNASDKEKGAFLQIWIQPKKQNTPPSYAQKTFKKQIEKQEWTHLINPNKKNGALQINQEAYLLLGHFKKKTTSTYLLNNPHNGVYVFVLEGSARIEHTNLSKRDAIAITQANAIDFIIEKPTKLLLIEVPLQ